MIVNIRQHFDITFILDKLFNSFKLTMKPIIASLFLVMVFLISCNNKREELLYTKGVTVDLAELRKEVLNDISYDLSFDIPGHKSEEIIGSVIINFKLKESVKILPLDFRVDNTFLTHVTVNGKVVETSIVDGHILIKGEWLEENNIIELTFRAGDMSLNRNDEFLYTLLVPDRASTLFPCFDQPDLKSRYRLRLVIPMDWKAIANTTIEEEVLNDERSELQFGWSEPLSSYLFAFAAGKFESVSRTSDGIEMEMLYRETDKKLVERNLDDIFRLHAESVRWMEDYTGIKYPFGKFGFALIPSFQYGGMEHPGAIFYRASSLFLQADASINQQLSRAGLIAHETSHMWFGDLVTMKWFNDVWLKEVFAGYMSDKIVNPSFPDVNHDLKFFLSRYPAAYAVDRTRGANPIIQPLGNLMEAGSLYGGIIYNKAPVVMKQLEMMIGDDLLRDGLRIYLRNYSYDNAEWADLIKILDDLTTQNLTDWSDIWVREAGMPTLEFNITETAGRSILTVTERDPAGKGRHWPQTLNTLIVSNDNDTARNTIIAGTKTELSFDGKIGLVIPDDKGISYGTFLLDSSYLEALANNCQGITDPVTRASVWLTLWENMINSRISHQEIFSSMIKALGSEKEKQITSLLRGRITSIYWNWMDTTERTEAEPYLAAFLSDLYRSNIDPAEKKSIFNSWADIALSKERLDTIAGILSGSVTYPGIVLSEDDRINLVSNLLLKEYPGAEELYGVQYEKTLNPDRKQRMAFIKPALSGNQSVRDLFFDSLKEESNREREPWVLEALGYLHHPLRADKSTIYLYPTLQLLEEIQVTGDIFFPFGWVSASFAGHRELEAWETVDRFLNTNPKYPENLRLKILQSTDHLYRLYGKE